jgi:hypothetical protein
LVDTVAALYVETDGVYFGLDGVDPWDEERDARLYRGPHPIVAHPPCKRWTNLALANFSRWGGEHNRPGNDGGCFSAALESIRNWGGVLEHPGSSRAWEHYGLMKPYGVGWCYQPDIGFVAGRGGYHVCEVWQSAYGHRAAKRTWLLYAGRVAPGEMIWVRVPGTHQVGHPDRRGKARNKPTLSKREAAATPPLFRDALISLARNARPEKSQKPRSRSWMDAEISCASQKTGKN